MPRSVAASASSFEDGDSGNPFLSADNPDSADLADQCDRARDSLACQGEQPPDLEASATCASAATERSRSEPREFGPRNKELPLSKEAVQRTARIHWFRQQVLNRLCYAYLEQHLRDDGTRHRSVAQLLSVFRRQSHGQDPEGIFELVRPRLFEQKVCDLRSDLATMLELLGQSVPANDEVWIRTTGREHHPSKQLVVQRLQLLLVAKLARRLKLRDARAYVTLLLEHCALGFYQDIIFTCWPLLEQAGQKAFQDWFHSGSHGPMPSSSSAPASGSRD